MTNSPSPSAQTVTAEVENFDGLKGLVSRFADALLGKLQHAANKGRSGWDATDWKADCQRGLARHVAKGDPLDVAAYAAFCWHHGWSTIGPITPDEYAKIAALKSNPAAASARNEELEQALRCISTPVDVAELKARIGELEKALRQIARERMKAKEAWHQFVGRLKGFARAALSQTEEER